MADLDKFIDRKAASKRFHELTAQAEAIRAKAKPMRERLDKHFAPIAAEERALRKEIKAAEAGLYEVDQERADIAKLIKKIVPNG